VETPDFLKVLQHFSGTSIQDAEAVIGLKDNFPFSQVLHTLSARVSKDHGLSNYQNELQLAAVYAADRAVLKEILEATASDSLVAVAPRVAETKSSPIPATAQNDLADQVLQDIERLHILKRNFELLFIDPTSTSVQIPAPVITETQPEEIGTENHRSKKERIIELAKTVTATPEPNLTDGLKHRRRKKDATETLIDQIVISKQELIPESEKHKEQIEIIDQFIKVQPTISGSKDRDSTPSDLATIKTGEFSDNIISETLVEILLKQGKKEKAVEVLKKLIWKFPQKKAYFATQIEELKK